MFPNLFIFSPFFPPICRPWSHVYSEREAAKLSQSVCRLAMTSAEDGGPVEGVVEGEEGPRSLPYMSSSAQASPGESSELWAWGEGQCWGLCYRGCTDIDFFDSANQASINERTFFSFPRGNVPKVQEIAVAPPGQEGESQRVSGAGAGVAVRPRGPRARRARPARPSGFADAAQAARLRQQGGRHQVQLPVST